jgi:hypothetical protein
VEKNNIVEFPSSNVAPMKSRFVISEIQRRGKRKPSPIHGLTRSAIHTARNSLRNGDRVMQVKFNGQFIIKIIGELATVDEIFNGAVRAKFDNNLTAMYRRSDLAKIRGISFGTGVKQFRVFAINIAPPKN